jgi:hypothetical protein
MAFSWEFLPESVFLGASCYELPPGSQPLLGQRSSELTAPGRPRLLEALLSLELHLGRRTDPGVESHGKAENLP